MNLDEVVGVLADLDNILVLRPTGGDGSPELAWEDVFFYYSPDGHVPPGQPFATVITKDYPGEPTWQAGDTGRIRVNIHAGAPAFADLLGYAPGEGGATDASAVDVVMPHPIYGALGWISVVDPGERTRAVVAEQLVAAYRAARRREERRRAGGSG